MSQLLKREDYSADSVFNTLCLYPADQAAVRTSGVAPLNPDSNDTLDYINERSLVKFFRRNGFFASKEDIQAIIRRFDLNYDEVVTREELFKFL